MACGVLGIIQLAVILAGVGRGGERGSSARLLVNRVVEGRAESCYLLLLPEFEVREEAPTGTDKDDQDDGDGDDRSAIAAAAAAAAAAAVATAGFLWGAVTAIAEARLPFTSRRLCARGRTDAHAPRPGPSTLVFAVQGALDSFAPVLCAGGARASRRRKLLADWLTSAPATSLGSSSLGLKGSDRILCTCVAVPSASVAAEVVASLLDDTAPSSWASPGPSEAFAAATVVAMFAGVGVATHASHITGQLS